MNSQANALGQIAGGPILGVVATVASLRAALMMAALAFAPGMLLLAGAARPDAQPAVVVDRQEDGEGGKRGSREAGKVPSP